MTWVNQGTNLHTISSLNAEWESGNLENGERFSFTFTRPGSYAYICRQHLLQGMRGTIVVEPP